MRSVILDCYTDEPSGLGVPPYIGTYTRYLSQALEHLRDHHYFYLTIDDLRFSHNKNEVDLQNPKKTINLTKNAQAAYDILEGADKIYVVMGCFISYDYFSCVPPDEDEIYHLLKDFPGSKIIFYELGIRKSLPEKFYSGKLASISDKIVLGNPYRFILSGIEDNYVPDYNLLDTITYLPCRILDQLERPYIIEIETASGCSHGKCSFCIEAHRKTPIFFREVDAILSEVQSLYKIGARHFRLGKQPNLFNYKDKDFRQFERLMYGIRQACPDIQTLHIDNVNAEDLVKPAGIEMVKCLVKYGTPGNITNFGVESFDPVVRKANSLNGSNEDVLKAVEIVNTHGAARGSDGMPLLLPGINLLFGLHGQSPSTHMLNMSHLQNILASGHLTRRLYFRKMTNPFGAAFGLLGKASDGGYELQMAEITKEFVMPIQEKVYPIGQKIYGLEEIVYDGNDTLVRKIGTCPERFRVRNIQLPSGRSYDIEVVSHDGPRKINAKICD